MSNKIQFIQLEDGTQQISETGIITFDVGSILRVDTSTISNSLDVVNVEYLTNNSSSLYTADDTIGTGRVATLTDTLRFKDGILQVEGANTLSTSSALQIYDGTPALLWDFRNNGDLLKANTVLNIGNNNSITGSITSYAIGSNNNISGGVFGKLAIGDNNAVNGSNSYTIGRYNSISANNVFQFGNFLQSTSQGAFVIGHGVYSDSAQKLVNNTASSLALGWNTTTPQHLLSSTGAILGGKVEMNTTTDGFLMPRLTTAQKNAISSPDTNLMVFDTDLSSLQRYNGTAWVDVAAGVGIVQLTQEGGSGGSVFYTDVQSALTAANSSGGDITITLHDNITTTTSISTNVTTNIDNITFDLNGFTITNTANDSGAVIFNKLQSNIITIINGSLIKTTGTGNALHFSSGIGDLYMSNCYVYSEAGSALKIDASVTPINIWELGNSTFKTNTGYGVYLADALGGISLTSFISISTGSGMACFLNAGGDVTNFKAIAEGTGAALRVRSSVTSATNFYAESNSGNCVLLESLAPIVKDFTAISVSGYAVFSSASAYKIENFYCKTTSGTRTLNVPSNSILINGDVFSDSTDCAFITGAERVENVNFTTNSGTNNVVSRFTTNWINCTFRNKDGVAFYNYGSSTSKFKKCTFISEKTSGGTAHAANIVDGASVVTFVNCDFEVADSTVNCIKGDAAMNMKVANCSFDGATTTISSNVTLSNTFTSDPYGNITI